jgi:single-stranded-DNA-specific exonuclease
VHITQLLRSVRRHLLDIGGHAQAAGFSLHKTQYDAFVDAVRDEMKKPAAPDKETLQNSLEMECELSPEMLSVESVDNIALFQPFGPSNPHPIFRTPPLVCTQAKRIGSAQQHVRCTFALLTPSVLGGAKQIAHTFSAVRWGKPTQPAPTPPTDQPLALATQLRTNTWQSVTKLQLEVLEWS